MDTGTKIDTRRHSKIKASIAVRDQREPSSLLSGLLLSLLTAAAFTAVVAPASAEPQRTIFRCVAAGGAVSYQDVPCPPDQRMTALHRFAAIAIDPALVARSREVEQEMDRRNHGRAAAVRVAASRPQKPAAPSHCEAAKAKREASLQRLGFKRDFELISTLDRAVWDACKGL